MPDDESKPSPVRKTRDNEWKPRDSSHGLGSILSPFTFRRDYARTLQQMMRSRYDAVAQEKIPDQLSSLVAKIRRDRQPR
jgi:hypothetical protein